MSELQRALDLVLETETGDPLSNEELEDLAGRLSEAVAEDAEIALGSSTVEMHGEPWWMCVHVWCMSERAREAVPAIATASRGWAREWRRESPRRRPVYMALTDAAGTRIEAFLVREDEQRLPAPAGRHRAFPIVQRRYAGSLGGPGRCI
jgi:hypothetical protein